MSSATAITIKLLAVLLLVAANGFFVAAEFALVGVRLMFVMAAGKRGGECSDEEEQERSGGSVHGSVPKPVVN